MRNLLPIPLVFLLLIAIGVPAFYIAGAVTDAALRQCPGGTFLSGGVYPNLKVAAPAALTAVLVMASMSFIARFSWFPEDYRDKLFGHPWSQTRVILFFTVLLMGIGGVWITNASQFCLSPDAVYQRAWPWQNLRRHVWTDVTRIDVLCQRDQHGSDLDYGLTMKDGSRLDISDGLPVWQAWNAYPLFQTALKGIPFEFAANVRPNCPSYFANWVGNRP